MRTFNRNIALNDVLKNSLPKSIWGKPAMESDLSILHLSFLIYHALHKKMEFSINYFFSKCDQIRREEILN